MKAAGTKAEGVDIPAELDVVATYPIAVTTEAGDPDAAAAWVAFITGDRGPGDPGLVRLRGPVTSTAAGRLCGAAPGRGAEADRPPWPFLVLAGLAVALLRPALPRPAVAGAVG